MKKSECTVWLSVLLGVIASRAAVGEMPWVRVADDRRGFVLFPSGKPLVPWGFNYDHDENGRLLEDYWDNEWPKVEEDFQEMKQLGANVARIHLQVARFMTSVDRIDEANLGRLVRLVALAEKTGVYLDVTGLGCYRKKDVPAWYERLDEEQRWAVQCRFWEAVAGRCAKSPAIFCYDLMNEPVVPGGTRQPGDWLGPPFLGSDSGYFVQCIALDQKDRPRPAIARQWCHRLVASIRKHDRRHLVTVGLVPWSLDRPGLTSGFVPRQIAPELDFIAVHLYPEKGKIKEAMETLSGFAVGKPVVVEETFPLNCPLPEFERFLDQSRKTASGWIGFYWGKTPDQCRKSHTIQDALMLRWLELFQKRADEALSGAPRVGCLKSEIQQLAGTRLQTLRHGDPHRLAPFHHLGAAPLVDRDRLHLRSHLVDHSLAGRNAEQAGADSHGHTHLGPEAVLLRHEAHNVAPLIGGNGHDGVARPYALSGTAMDGDDRSGDGGADNEPVALQLDLSDGGLLDGHGGLDRGQQSLDLGQHQRWQLPEPPGGGLVLLGCLVEGLLAFGEPLGDLVAEQTLVGHLQVADGAALLQRGEKLDPGVAPFQDDAVGFHQGAAVEHVHPVLLDLPGQPRRLAEVGGAPVGLGQGQAGLLRLQGLAKPKQLCADGSQAGLQRPIVQTGNGRVGGHLVQESPRRGVAQGDQQAVDPHGHVHADGLDLAHCVGLLALPVPKPEHQEPAGQEGKDRQEALAEAAPAGGPGNGNARTQTEAGSRWRGSAQRTGHWRTQPDRNRTEPAEGTVGGLARA
jgi:hypothetical protein